ncbi:MAG: hypothetical protein QNJ81_14315 [Acidimicrobiia bacterium]|nr:hypothetical protein [Acidimicrobiia bacterium]
MSTWWSEHPDLEGVARKGRGELIADAASAEADTEHLRKRRRSLVDVCFEWMSRGDQVTVSAAGSQYTGRLSAALNDLLVLETNDRVVAVNTGAVEFARSDGQARFPGTSGERAVASFRAYLGRHEVDGTPVRLVGATFDIVALVEACSDDHVLARDEHGVEWALPQQVIAFAVAE